jgi:16S rRNA processing protein RimM
VLLAGHLAKVQGLKGEFLLHAVMDDPAKLASTAGLVLAPAALDLESAPGPTGTARPIQLRAFRWHGDRACVAFEGIPDRTAAEPFRGWALWMPEAEASLEEGESFRHDWVGCEVFVQGRKVGEVTALVPSPGGYDMVHMKDLRPGRTGRRDIPYIKAWWTLDLPRRRLDLDPPEGLLDLDRLPD